MLSSNPKLHHVSGDNDSIKWACRLMCLIKSPRSENLHIIRAGTQKSSGVLETLHGSGSGFRIQTEASFAGLSLQARLYRTFSVEHKLLLQG